MVYIGLDTILKFVASSKFFQIQYYNFFRPQKDKVNGKEGQCISLLLYLQVSRIVFKTIQCFLAQ